MQSHTAKDRTFGARDPEPRSGVISPLIIVITAASEMLSVPGVFSGSSWSYPGRGMSWREAEWDTALSEPTGLALVILAPLPVGLPCKIMEFVPAYQLASARL